MAQHSPRSVEAKASPSLAGVLAVIALAVACAIGTAATAPAYDAAVGIAAAGRS